MKKLQLYCLILLLLGINACCLKSEKCSITSFDNIKLEGFPDSLISAGVILSQYQGGGTFSIPLNSQTMYPQKSSDGSAMIIETGKLSISNDYELDFIKNNSKYRIKNFTVKRVSCGKCIMRSNNQFGYALDGYYVNTKYYNYDGMVTVIK